MKKYRYSLGEMLVRLLKIALPIRSYLIVSTLASVIGNLSHMGLMAFGAAALLKAAGIMEGSVLYSFIMALVCAMAIGVCRYLEGVYSHIGAYGLLAGMRVSLFEKLDRVAPAYLIDRKKGDIISIAVSDIETLEHFFAHTIGPMFTVILLPLTTLLLAGHYHPYYVLVLIPVFLLVSVVIPLLALRSGRNFGARQRSALGELSSLILESVYGIKDIQIFSQGEKRKDLVLKQSDVLSKASHALLLHQQAVTSVPNFFVYLGRMLILAVSAYLLSKGSGDVAGAVIVSFAAVASFSSTFSLTFVVTHLLEAFAAAERIFIIEDTTPEVNEPEDPIKIQSADGIVFEDVSFHYPHSDRKILDHLDLKIEKGQTIGIIGESGIGKSTILRLLLRFYEMNEGNIFISDTDIRRIPLKILHQKIKMLEQETYLFDTSIYENIAMGRPGASLDEVKQAAKRAGIAGFIDTLEEGYDTQMGQMSSRLSGGERQRIGIARILLADPDVIVMDEPTSSLDVLHEKEFLQTLENEYKDKTIIIVSHRMSTLSNCETIYKLENGKLIKI